MSVALTFCFCVSCIASSGSNYKYEYKASSRHIIQSTIDYVIIAEEDMRESIADFVSWKETRGYAVTLETLANISQSYEGRDLAEQIRNYLIERYLDWNIRYVLFIGSRNTIPMRICIPFSAYHEDEFLQCPTDYYYADLTGDWDADADNFFGEYQDDAMDFNPEVIVGRIPSDDTETVAYILQNSILYESNTSAWKQQVLLPGAVIFYEKQNASGYTWTRSDAATFMEECRLDIFEPSGYQCTRMYEEEGLRPSTYDHEKALTRENVKEEWTKGYGLVNMLGHAGNTLITRLIWTEDDGDTIPEYPGELDYTPFLRISDSSDLTCVIPPIVYSSGCAILRTAYNMGETFLEDGAAVAFIGTTQGSWYNESLRWDTEADGGTCSLSYYFFKNLIENKQSCGNALYSSKLYYHTQFWYHGFNTNWIFRAYDNMYSLTFYGDPSLSLYTPSSAPMKPDTPTGPSSGKIRTTYGYTTKSQDPDEDDIRYLLNWGDGTSTLTGYYSSNENIMVNHTWKKQGTFDIRVRCSDIHGSWSDWSEPISVTIPKNKSQTIYHHFYEIIAHYLEKNPWFTIIKK